MDKYNEALERAKKWEREHPHGYVIEDMMEYIFPGFREPELTELEKAIYNILSFDCNTEKDSLRVEFAKSATKDLLAIAKKELCKGCTVGLDQYWKGRDDARKEAEKPITYHFPTYWPPCYHGGVCTNPMKDCVNCPRTGGDIGTFTTSGTCKKED